MKKLPFTILFIIIFTITLNAQETSPSQIFLDVKGPYLGQNPPGTIPEIFAPGIICTDTSEGCSGWGNNMEYFISQRWVNRKPYLYIINRINESWTVPKLISSADQYLIGDFTIAPDGKTLIFASNIFIEEIGSEGEGGNIWVMEKTDIGWTEAKLIGAAINTKYHDSYPSLAANKNLYFFSRKPGGFGASDLYMSIFEDGKYQPPINLGNQLNTSYHEWDPYIAPDESYMVYCSMMPGGLGEDDLYITFKQNDGTWGSPIHLGNEINSDQSENRPYVTPDGKYLFYVSTKSGNMEIYWVSTLLFDRFKK